MKRELTGWKRIFVKHVSDKGLIPRINKELSQLKENNLIKKIGKDLKFLKEERWMTNKHMKRYSNS